jgi:hypothetical protein
MTAADSSTNKGSILVTGDIVMDHYIYEGRQRRTGSTIRLGTISRETRGGAGLLYELLFEMASKRTGMAVVSGLDFAKLPASLAAGYCVMRPFLQKKGKKREVWRLADPLGFN